MEGVPFVPLVVGVSGGCDSMVLIDRLYREGYDVAIAHVHHGLREASDEEARFIESWAASRAIPFFMTRLDWTGRVSSQAACREARYAFFERIMEATARFRLILAHHQDDQVETLLIQLVRGEANIDGIPDIRPFGNGWLHRPLLRESKQELLEYAEQYKVPWREDMSNAETTYLRNQIRHTVLPPLRESRPGFEHATVAAAHARQRITREHATFVATYLKRCQEERGFPIGRILELPADLQRFVLPTLTGETFSSDVITRFISWLRVDKGSDEVYYGNWRMRRAYGFLMQDRVIRSMNDDLPFQVGENLGTYHYGEQMVRFSTGNQGIPLDAITFPLTVRRPLPGDRIQLAVGSKKVSRILIDAKVPRYLRDHIPVVVDANGVILAVIGHRIAIFGSFELLAKSYLMIEW
ncbi:tRNA lysidine(34) synthetase TilS [Exiguobacterium sp. TDN 0502]|uniref:tRNA lysidine(34) synthetase TilS n=1 Tax=Exiguobacterium sp. TDN 0502 TaxID=3420731 RepID=UPI003D780DDB